MRPRSEGAASAAARARARAGPVDPLAQVAIRWDAERTVILTVHVIPDAGAASGEEWRIAQEIAATIWGGYHLAELGPPSEQ